jgi:Phage terminase large subunit
MATTTSNLTAVDIRFSDIYKPWPKQWAFHKMNCKHRLQIGGFGSGKSRPLLMEAVRICMRYPGVNAIILRKTMPDLKRTVIDKFEADIPKQWYEYHSQERGTFNKSDHIVYWPPRVVDGVKRQSKLYFGACERIEDVGKYLSTEFIFVGFEELGEFPYLIYDAMEGRNRCTVPGVPPACMASASNPMGIGWGWIKRVWVDHLPVRGMDPEKYDPNDYGYIHSTVDDNPILSQDARYVASLEKSPLRDKIRYGRVDTVSGQYFANFEESRHVRPKSDFIFESWQPVWIGWDYGFGHFAVITFWTKAVLKPRFDEEKPRIVNVMIAELVLNERTPKQQTEALIASIPLQTDKEGKVVGFAWDIDSIHLSWERFNRTVENRTVADEIGDYLSAAGLPRPTRSNNDRVAGWTKMYEMLEMDEWFILQSACPCCCEAIPLLVRGDGVTCSMEDVIKPKGLSLEDDCADAMRYAVAGVLLDEGQKPKDMLLREKLAGIKEPIARAAAMYKNYNQEQAMERRPPRERIVPTWQKRLK